MAVFLITGAPGIGKSTVLSKVVLRLRSEGVIVGGCITLERRKQGERVGFSIEDLTDGTVGELASTSGTVGPRLGRYRVNISSLSAVGARALREAARSSEVIVVDEVGPMELLSPEFKRAVRVAAESGKPVLAVVHEKLRDDLLDWLRETATLQEEVTLHNRDALPDRLSEVLLEKLKGPKHS